MSLNETAAKQELLWYARELTQRKGGRAAAVAAGNPPSPAAETQLQK